MIFFENVFIFIIFVFTIWEYLRSFSQLNFKRIHDDSYQLWYLRLSSNLRKKFPEQNSNLIKLHNLAYVLLLIISLCLGSMITGLYALNVAHDNFILRISVFFTFVLLLILLWVLNVRFNLYKSTINSYLKNNFDQDVSISSYIDTLLQNLIGRQTMIVSLIATFGMVVFIFHLILI